MNVLGIGASYRKLGNTEILVREALEACSEKGAQTSFVRLTDFDIKPCKGCMACVFKSAECRITDDMASLIQLMDKNDYLILGSPTYLLSPPGVIKMILDRFFMAQTRFKGKKASTIGVAALPQWEPFLLPMLNMLVLSFGYQLVDSQIFYAAGPGEVLLEENDIKRAREIGKRLLSENPAPVNDDACPVCKARFISLEHMKCPVCGLSFSVKDGKVVYNPPEHHRFTEEGWREHLENWILRTEGRYFNRIEEIQRLREKYQ